MASAQLDELDQAFDLLMNSVANEPQSIFDARVARWRGCLDAEEARRLAAKIGDDGDIRDAARAARNAGRRSKRAARAAAKRAAAVKANAELADKMAAGELSAEQVETIADAMETDPSAATDQGLIDSVENTSVDQGRKVGRDWAAKRAKQTDTQAEHDRQRGLRSASTYKDHTKDLSVLRLEGDDSTINRIWNQLLARSRAMYEADGGRDLARSAHPRTYDQRLFDAAVEAILFANAAGTRSSSGSGSKPVAVVDIPIEKLADPDRCAELVGSGPIPDSVLVELLQAADVWFQISGLKGQPLWLARDRRKATRSQLIAMIMRDKGCVQCGANYLGCDAHHNTPYNSPAQGETNIDNMTLNCSADHHDLHNNNLTLIPNEAKPNSRDQSATWTTRPATKDEIAPKKRKPPPARNRPPPKTRNHAVTPTRVGKVEASAHAAFCECNEQKADSSGLPGTVEASAHAAFCECNEQKAGYPASRLEMSQVGFATRVPSQ